MGRWLAPALVIVATAALLVQVAVALPVLFEQIHLPYSVNLWSEGPILVQVHRIATGTAPYGPPALMDSWIYGPVYPYLLAAIDHVIQRAPTIVPLRYISLIIGLATVIPIVLGVLASAAGTGQRVSWTRPIAACFVTAAFLLVDARSPTFVAIHPDQLTFLLIATAFAATVAFGASRKPVLLAIVFASCVLDALTKANTTPLFAFFLGYLLLKGSMGLRGAALWLGGFIIALGVCYLVMPSSMRQWTLVIPSHHTYATLALTFERLYGQWFVARPFAGWLVLTALGVVFMRYRRGGLRAALALACVPAGVFVTGFVPFASVGSGANDLWTTYVAVLIPLGSFLDEGMSGALPLSLAAAACALGLPVLAFLGTDRPQALNALARVQMAQTAESLRALCMPGRTIYLTWLVDPLLNCPEVHFTLWDSVGEVLWATGTGYRTRTPFDGPIEPGAFVDIVAHPYVHAHLEGQYVQTLFPIFDRESDPNLSNFIYYPQNLNVWVKRPPRPAGAHSGGRRARKE